MSRFVFRKSIEDSYGNSLIRVDSGTHDLPSEIFGLIKLNDYDLFLEAVRNEESFQISEIVGFQCGPLDGSPFDGIDPLLQDEVEIGFGEDVVKITKKEFFKLCSEFGHKIIEAIAWFDLANQNMLSNEQIEKIEALVSEIDRKIQQRH